MTRKPKKPSRPPKPPLKLVDEEVDTPVNVDALYDALVALLISAHTRGKIPGPDGKNAGPGPSSTAPTAQPERGIFP